MRRSVTAGRGRARPAPTRITVAKGSGLSDITIGDVIEYETERRPRLDHASRNSLSLGVADQSHRRGSLKSP
ncbi:hypothetical protein ABT224_36830 [Streptomyces sp. NPDC001584]|uniref:hypothetical protein n=1 Tax=Streptomyces sp. NPDC001584 TaxID=3154521 RepID=UPI003330289B